MKVSELMALLRNMPQDYDVIYQYMTDLTALDSQHIEVVGADQKKIVQQHNNPSRYCYYHAWHQKEGVEPIFVNAVVFPGN